VHEEPTIPFSEGKILPDIPQKQEDLAFGREDIRQGCVSGIYESITRKEAEDLKARGMLISSAFTVWQDSADGRKGRFVVNLAVQSKHWPKGSIRMETLPAFSLDLSRGDHMLSFDIKSGYRHFRLSRKMRDYFAFHYDGGYYRCVALPFGWGRSPLWFTEFMRPVVRAMRNHGMRVLPYLDDFLVVPSRAGTVASPRDCRKAAKWLEGLLRRIGIVRHPNKGEWVGSTRVEHLGVVVDTKAMKFFICPRKVLKIQSMARNIVQQAIIGRRWVSRSKLRSFAGTCVSLTLAMPFARFFTRSIYDDLSTARRGARRERPASRQGDRVRLSHQSLRDLRTWQRLARAEKEGRRMHPPVPDGIMHTDAADVGYGGTLDREGQPGDQGAWESQGVWGWKDRAQSINVRELKAVRLLLQGTLGEKSKAAGMSLLRLCVDNKGVVAVTNAFVSSSSGMMRELRRLKRVLDDAGLQLATEWIPSAANKFADSLSRRFPVGDLQVRETLVRSVVDGLRVTPTHFPHPATLGEHPVYARKRAFAELASTWNRDEVRLLCPPVDLLSATVRKLRRTQAPAILMMPDWPAQAWHVEALQLAERSTLLDQAPAEVWRAQRSLNPKWRLRLVEVNMPSPAVLPL
jgi:hypothetical protein